MVVSRCLPRFSRGAGTSWCFPSGSLHFPGLLVSYLPDFSHQDLSTPRRDPAGYGPRVGVTVDFGHSRLPQGPNRTRTQGRCDRRLRLLSIRLSVTVTGSGSGPRDGSEVLDLTLPLARGVFQRPWTRSLVGPAE